MFHNVRITVHKRSIDLIAIHFFSIHLPTTSKYLNKCVNTKLKKPKPFIISIIVYFSKIIKKQRKQKIENHTQNFFSNSYFKSSCYGKNSTKFVFHHFGT